MEPCYSHWSFLILSLSCVLLWYVALNRLRGSEHPRIFYGVVYELKRGHVNPQLLFKLKKDRPLEFKKYSYSWRVSSQTGNISEIENIPTLFLLILWSSCCSLYVFPLCKRQEKRSETVADCNSGLRSDV